MTGLGKFGLKACFGGWGLWKNPNLRSRLWKPNFSKSINSEQFLRWIPQHCAQSWSDNIYIYPLIARLQVSRVWRERVSLQGIEKIESRLGFWFHWWFWIESLVRYLLVLAADRGIVFWIYSKFLKTNKTVVFYSKFIQNSWEHCAQFKRGPKIFRKGTKRGHDFEQKGDLKGTKKGT